MVKEGNMGLMGGTFDPVHLAHLAVAEEARKALKLSVVLFVPAGQPWLKSNRTITPTEDRVEMLGLAIADKPYFEVSTMEIERPGASYSVDTVREIKARLGKAGELYFI